MDKIKSVAEFIEAIKGLAVPPDGFLTYRGERDASWITQPGIFRPERAKLLEFERHAIREMLSVQTKEFDSDASMFDRLVRMQHYHLPTRLLDVSQNPLVALFFATEIANPKLELKADGKVVIITVPREREKYFDSDTVSCLANLANLSKDEKEEVLQGVGIPQKQFNVLPPVERLIQFVRAEKPYFAAAVKPDEMARSYFVWPKLSNRRIIAQRGAFLIMGLLSPSTLPGGPPKLGFGRIEIDADFKGPIRNELDTLGINQSALFPEIDSTASQIKLKYAI